MSKLVGQIMVGIACLAVFHAAFSTYEYLSTMKAISSHPAKLPTSIVIEALFALLLFIPGTVLAAEQLEDVTYRGELAKRSIDDSEARMGFMRLSSRGRALFGDDSGVSK